jgi:hypothetical protein
MGGPDPARRTRALGIRDRILSCLAGGEVSDPKGMAAAVLAEGVGYPGSSAAFAQLLSGMERSGLIERQIRGKRTYRIAAVEQASRGPAVRADRAPAAQAGQRTAPGDPAGRPGADLLPATGDAAGFDYDELARRLLIQVVRRLATAQDESPPPEPEMAGDAAFHQTVFSLESRLASATSQQQKLTAENASLRKQLQAARQSLAQAEERAKTARVTGELGAPELQLLERLLSVSRDQTDRQEEAGAS